ncbi:MtN3-like protein [Phytophthora infestans T30-4]|uniref:Sugar transporter SWEET1 n=1 Tax=Phytophthora infestans (strain T30-4) TaxID=403677 RepID=D0N2J5_PHYIT|nr:MtN3-like protein [Phytophthora infestans T30-4]EEY68524.1 MtN3-like protein [Phytophthora infestans T30-4]|eukprot:XP_002905683.1 MtN3-like protein [Phytophthora infestans T30-4]
MLALSIVNVVATITSVALCLSPYPDFRRIHTQKSTGEVRILPVVMLCCNCVLWALYGLSSGNYFPVMSINIFGIVTTVTFSAIFYRWSAHRTTLNKMAGCTGLGLCTVILFTVLAMTGVVPVSTAQLQEIIGYCAVSINICLYAAPLQTMKLVITTKSSASLPITMCVVNLFNGTLWCMYAILSNDMFVLTPNSLGVVMCIVQIEPLNRARSEMVLAVTTCAEAVAIEFARSKSCRAVATPQIPQTA